MERYKVAFAKYDELYVQWLTRVKTAVKEKREEARKKAEIMSDTEDEVILQNIESSFFIVDSADDAIEKINGL